VVVWSVGGVPLINNLKFKIKFTKWNKKRCKKFGLNPNFYFFLNGIIFDLTGGCMKDERIRADILTRKEAAAFIGVCQNTLDKLDIPKTKVRRRVFYKIDELNKWIDDHTEKKKG